MSAQIKSLSHSRISVQAVPSPDGTQAHVWEALDSQIVAATYDQHSPLIVPTFSAVAITYLILFYTKIHLATIFIN